MTAAAKPTATITVPQAFGVVRKVAPEIFAQFKPTLAKLAPDTRDKEYEAAIRYAADVVADADVSKSSHAEVAKRSLTECLRRSLRYVAPENVAQFPGVGSEAAQPENGRCSTALPLITALELKTKEVGNPEFIVEGWIRTGALGSSWAKTGPESPSSSCCWQSPRRRAESGSACPSSEGRLYFSRARKRAETLRNA